MSFRSDANAGRSTSTGSETHMIVLPGGGYATHEAHEAEPIAELAGTGWAYAPACSATPCRCGTPCRLRHCGARSAGAARRGADRIGLIGFSAGGHLAGLAALAPSADDERVGRLRRPRLRDHVDGDRDLSTGADDPAGRGRDAAATPRDLPGRARHAVRAAVLLWHTAEDIYVPPEHTYRLARALAANEVPHTVHVFAHGPHSLGLARGAGDVERWTTLAASWIAERVSPPIRSGSETNPLEARA